MLIAQSTAHTVSLPPGLAQRARWKADYLNVSFEELMWLALDLYLTTPEEGPAQRVPVLTVVGSVFPTQVADGQLWVRWPPIYRTGILGGSDCLRRLFPEETRRKLHSANFHGTGPASVLHVEAGRLRAMLAAKGAHTYVHAVDMAMNQLKETE